MRALVLLTLSALVLAGCSGPATPDMVPDGDLPRTEDGGVDLVHFGVVDDPFFGDPDAPVQVVGYEAPGCPSCAWYHANVLDGILEDYADTGRIGYHMLQYTVGYAYDTQGGVAAECGFREGGSAAYRFLIDRIFATQKDASRLPGYLDDAAMEFGLDAQALQTCYEDQETLDEVQADIDAGRDSGAGSNPGFAVVGPDGVELVKGRNGPRDAIERALAAA